MSCLAVAVIGVGAWPLAHAQPVAVQGDNGQRVATHNTITTGAVNSAIPAPAKPVDVRLVIDVSGSMKRNDPNNLRRPAVDLLVKLLPEGSKSGVWTFGKWVNMLVPHKSVDDNWRQEAGKKAGQINSVGLFTNIGEALEKAAYDIDDVADSHRKSIILLTDGVVDISKQPELNRREWRRIVDEVLPKLKAAGFTIHSIALSDNADIDLLNKLSLATDGLTAVAHSAEDLMAIFLKAFDAAAPAEQVPLSDNQFVIDSSVEEFTALIFRREDSALTQLIGPDNAQFDATTKDPDLSWYHTQNYDLITVRRPLEGGWQVDADMAPQSRITVVSNLNLRVAPLPRNVMLDYRGELALMLQEDGKTIVRPEFLQLMDIQAQIHAGNDDSGNEALRNIWQATLTGGDIPVDGIFSTSMPIFDREGFYRLDVSVDGKSFTRKYSHSFEVRKPFSADIKSVFQEGRSQYQLTVRTYSDNVDVARTQMVATITNPKGINVLRPMAVSEQDSWLASIMPEIEGRYTLLVNIKGLTRDGQVIDTQLRDLSFNYSAQDGLVAEKEPFFKEEAAVVTPTPAPATAAPTERVEEPLAADSGLPMWVWYAVLGLGNLLVFGLGFFAFKKIMGGDKEDILEQFSEEKLTQSEAEPDVPVEEVPDEEPPMEDLDPALESDPEPVVAAAPESDRDLADELMSEPVVETPAVADAGMDTMSMDDLAMDDMDLGAMAADPPASAPTASPADDDDIMSDVMADFDDLEAMVMDTPDEPSDLPSPPSDDDDDMVNEMLKAQGLDLAGEELDDAISSLIDGIDDEVDKDDFDFDDLDDDDKV